MGEEVTGVLFAGEDWVHFNQKDNNYTPNLTIGPFVCEAIYSYAVKDGKPAIKRYEKISKYLEKAVCSG